MDSPEVDIATLTQAQMEIFLAGYLSGYAAGVERGRELADREAAARHHQAWRVVQAMAKIPTHEDVVRQRRERTRAAAARAQQGDPIPEPDQPVRASLAAARTRGAA